MERPIRSSRRHHRLPRRAAARTGLRPPRCSSGPPPGSGPPTRLPPRPPHRDRPATLP